jgi:hypothetical protein
MQMTNVESFYLDDTKVTDEGIEKLQRALTNFYIN